MRNNVQQPPGSCCHRRPRPLSHRLTCATDLLSRWPGCSRSSNADGQIRACADQLISASPAQPEYQTAADDFEIGRVCL
jgi:hypothetical protein